MEPRNTDGRRYSLFRPTRRRNPNTIGCNHRCRLSSPRGGSPDRGRDHGRGAGGPPPFRPEAEADPFQVLQQLAPSSAQGSWLLVTTELAAHHGPGVNWCAALAAFPPPPGAGRGAPAGLGGTSPCLWSPGSAERDPSSGCDQPGRVRAPRFNPALELGLPWLGHLPAGGAPTTPAWQDQLWLLRENCGSVWRQLCCTEQVTAPSTGDLGPVGRPSPGQQRQHQQHEVQHHGGGQ